MIMGGQACVLYGAAEFSRDADFAVLANLPNLSLLQEALDELQAEVIAVPPFEVEYLERGHAVHFRCRHPEAQDIRVDIMARMRGVEDFTRLWERRTTVVDDYGLELDLLSLPDLVKAKKTQRDKDWPMIKRLVEVHYLENEANPSVKQIEFWLRESRMPSMLLDLAATYEHLVSSVATERPLLQHAVSGDEVSLTEAIAAEEKRERDEDRMYWQPLKAELEQLRRKRRI